MLYSRVCPTLCVWYRLSYSTRCPQTTTSFQSFGYLYFQKYLKSTNKFKQVWSEKKQKIILGPEGSKYMYFLGKINACYSSLFGKIHSCLIPNNKKNSQTRCILKKKIEHTIRSLFQPKYNLVSYLFTYFHTINL